MQITVRFPLAVEFLLLCEHYKDDEVANGNIFACRMNTSSHFMRQIMADLAKGGLIESKMGPKGGITLLKDINEITLYDVYICLGEDEGSFLKFAKTLNKKEYTENQIQFHNAMEADFEDIKTAFEAQLKGHTVGEYYKSYYGE